MKLSQSQIDTIIEGLENPNTLLLIKSGEYTYNVYKKVSSFEYMDKTDKHNLFNRKGFINYLNDISSAVFEYEFELVTRTKI